MIVHPFGGVLFWYTFYMKKEILDYISTQRVCVIAVEMPDGSPHAATVHFAHTDEPLTFIVQTSPSCRKAESLQTSERTRVSIVVGVTEESDGKDKTFQLDGEAQLIESDSELVEAYLCKFPDKRGKWLEDIFLALPQPGGDLLTGVRQKVRQSLIQTELPQLRMFWLFKKVQTSFQQAAAIDNTH